MKKDCPNARIAAMYAAAEEQDTEDNNDAYHDAEEAQDSGQEN
jgi:hypothetical protein